MQVILQKGLVHGLAIGFLDQTGTSMLQGAR